MLCWLLISYKFNEKWRQFSIECHTNQKIKRDANGPRSGESLSFRSLFIWSLFFRKIEQDNLFMMIIFWLGSKIQEKQSYIICIMLMYSLRLSSQNSFAFPKFGIQQSMADEIMLFFFFSRIIDWTFNMIPSWVRININWNKTAENIKTGCNNSYLSYCSTCPGFYWMCFFFFFVWWNMSVNVQTVFHVLSRDLCR